METEPIFNNVFDTALEEYVKELTEKHLEYDKKHWPGLLEKHGQYSFFIVQRGSKYAKILVANEPNKKVGAVHCFVEIANGNIHKAASWNAPQKNGVRGNIYKEKKPIFGGEFYAR